MFLDVPEIQTVAEKGIDALLGAMSPDEGGPEEGKLWTPYPGPQTLAFNCGANMIFYGGGAGGGKSDLGLGLAIEKHTKSQIFRRTYPQLTELIERSREIIRTAGTYNQQEKIWRIHNRRRRFIQFGSMEHDKDKLNWQGRPASLKNFDEAPQFTESMVDFATMWNRSPIPGELLQILLTGNPPTEVDGEWIMEWFDDWLGESPEDPAKPGEIRWYIRNPDNKWERTADNKPINHTNKLGKTVKLYPLSRTFIPALVTDNPTYLHDEQYIARLMSAPEPLRSMMLYGDMSQRRKDDAWQVIPSEWVKLAQERWRNTRWIEEPLSLVSADVAQGGDDSTVIAQRFGYYIAQLTVVQGEETDSGPKAAKLVLNHHEPGVKIHIDAMPSAPYEFLKDWKISPLVPINFGQSATYADIQNKTEYYTDKSGKFRFGNWRAFAYWRLRELLDPQHGKPIALPPDKLLYQELIAARYKIVGVNIFLEPKEDIKQRIRRSPDRADCVVMAFCPSPSSVAGLYVPQSGSVDNTPFKKVSSILLPDDSGQFVIRNSK